MICNMSNILKNLKPLQSETIAVAMSGGVDSAAALYLAKQMAGRVFGITAIMTSEESRCCSSSEVESAARVAKQLGVEHHVVEVKETFSREVIDYFCYEYVAGQTPSPCVMCNRYIKFGELAEKAQALGADKIATGHYARACCGGGDALGLYRGLDVRKDQSYFLAMLDQKQLERACFPVGELTKDKVRELVREADLKVNARGESQEVCFVTEGTHGTWIDLRRLNTGGPGDIVDMAGRRLGRHTGIHHYTVGQRRGLGVASDRRLFVVSINRESNEVVLGDRQDAEVTGMSVSGLSWISGGAGGSAFECEVQVRYAQKAAACSVSLLDGGRADVRFAEVQFGVAPGQLAVFFDGEKVLGGGWITR